ncbi:hypothetical protein BC2230_90262 [Burkholderia cepacia]
MLRPDSSLTIHTSTTHLFNRIPKYMSDSASIDHHLIPKMKS